MAGVDPGTVVLVVYVLAVGLSPVVAPAIVFAERERSATAAVGRVVGVLAAGVTLGATAVAALVSPITAVVAFLAGFGALLGLVVLPLLVGRGIVRARTGVERERALVLAVAGWPVALAGSLGLFWGVTAVVAWPLSALSWLAWVVLVLVGPGLFGTALQRLFERVR